MRPRLTVNVVLKQDQRTGSLTRGVVKDVLTKSSFHPHAIKVGLETGEVGREDGHALRVVNLDLPPEHDALCPFATTPWIGRDTARTKSPRHVRAPHFHRASTPSSRRVAGSASCGSEASSNSRGAAGRLARPARGQPPPVI